MRLREALSVLSKSSPYAVSTERSRDSESFLDEIKSYLYVEMPIEDEVNDVISSFDSSDHKILFLCGSSGDGKSELLTKAKCKYGQHIKFHLDATHSFEPQKNAIETLDKVFEQYEGESKPLVVGINTGMLGNYANEGKCERLKEAISSYLLNGERTDGVYFINFEDFPKFQIEKDGYVADFAEKLLQKITDKSGNPVRRAYDLDKLECSDLTTKRLISNYELLSIPFVQKSIVDLLFKARLMRDQFLTARALLDFTFILLAGPSYLFDNLFSGGDNELASKIVEFDPAHLRTKKIDRFILSNDLNLPDKELNDFKEGLAAIGINDLEDSQSYLRLFYLLRHGDFANNYHRKFVHDFGEVLIEKYVDVYQIHGDYEGHQDQRLYLKNFYNNILRAAIRKYNNRNAPNLDKNHHLIADLNGYQLVAKLDIKADFKSITKSPPISSSSFTACIKVEDKSLNIPVNINLLRLMIRIVDGYRPNKHDKNTVVLLDELLEDIAKVASDVDTLHIIKNDQHYTIKNVDNEEFEVSGL